MYVTEIENEEFMTPPQLKRYLGLSTQTQAKMRARQGCFAKDEYPLPFIKLGARVLYRKSSIDEWIKNKEHSQNLGGENEK